jgi:preprotein translocase subunit SecG
MSVPLFTLLVQVAFSHTEFIELIAIYVNLKNSLQKSPDRCKTTRHQKTEFVMFSVLLVLLVIVAVMMIGVILLQKSEGSGMSGSSAASMFGGALTGASAGNFFTKTTTILAIIFFVLCGALAIVSSKSASKPAVSELQQELVAPSAPVEVPEN